MNSAYLTVYQGKEKFQKHFVFNNIVWFQKRDKDIVFKTIDNEIYTCLNLDVLKFKNKFKGE